MVQDAEDHAEEDRKFAELAEARNQADGLAHATEKAINEMGDKISDDEKGPIQEAIDGVKEAIKGDDKEAIEAASVKLTEVSGPVMQKMYAEQAAAAGAGPDMGDMGGQAQPEGNAGAGDDVVDAEFTEVKDEDKK